MSAASRLTIRVKENPNGPSDLYGIDQFTYVPEENCYICPEGKPLKYVGINPRNRTHLYYSTPKRCASCSQKSRCTRGKYRSIAIHTCESARQRAPALAEIPAFAISQRARRKVEALFAELKNYIGHADSGCAGCASCASSSIWRPRAEPETASAIPQPKANPADCYCMNLTPTK